MKVTQTAANVIDDNNTSQPIAASESRLTTQSANRSWAKVNFCYPLPSNRQHLSYDVCLEVRGEIIRTVLC